MKVHVPAAPTFAKHALLSIALLATAGSALAQSTSQTTGASTIEEAIRHASPLVRVYNDHLSFLGHPFLDGRIPGSRGMEIAKDYVEDHFRAAGLAAPFVDADGNPSYRQDFPISSQAELVSQSFGIGTWTAVAGTDFTALSLGGGGNVSGDAVFVGYSIDNGRDGYSSFEEGERLDGKIAVMLRFEPMNEEGASQWSDRGWSARAGFARKISDAVERGAAGVVIINPPGAADDRADTLPTFASSGRTRFGVPVLCLSTKAGEALVRASGPKGKDLLALRREADAGRVRYDLSGNCQVNVETRENELVGQNVCALIRGRGTLAKEIVVIGAHLDHLGMGEYGSRSGPGELHPGADDNASGCAAMIILGERFMEYYAALPADANVRTLMIQCYDAEEAGLIGSFYYSRNPIQTIEDHVLMLNFDMIGRIVDRKLAVSGLSSGEGLAEWVRPMLAATPLDIVAKDGVPAASDHWPFYQANVPVLFAICEPLHADYHTPADTIDKINRIDAVEAMLLWENIARAMITRPERFAYSSSRPTQRRERAPADEAAPPTPAPGAGESGSGPVGARVRLGLTPASYEETSDGVEVGTVSADSPASRGGIQTGDRMIKWGGKALGNAAALAEFLRGQKPGDEVEIVLVREGNEVKVTVTLEERG